MKASIRLEGRGVLLRPFRAREEKRWWESRRAQAPGVVAGSPPSRERARKMVSRSGRLWRGRLDLAIETSGRLIGDIQARTGWAHGFPPAVFEIGIGIWDPTDRGRGHGPESVRLLTSWLFEDAGAARVQLSTSVDNAAMRRAAEKIGFRLEGVLRAYWPSPGGHEDYAMYAVTRDDGLPIP